MNAIATVTDLLTPGAIRAGEPIHHGPVSLVPLFHDGPPFGYVRFGELPSGAVTVTEVNSAGHVPELLVTNQAPQPVLFLEGEVLVGLKQDRTLNVTVLVPAHSQINLPVACVEQGRWNHTSSQASRGDFNLSPSARFHKTASTQRSVRATGRYSADQGIVWGSVQSQLLERGIESPSLAYRDVAAAPPEPGLAAMFDIEPEADQRGVLAIIDGHPVAADLFDRHDTLQGAWDGLIQSYATDASRAEGGEPPVDRTAAISMLTELAQGQATEHPGVGAGSIVQITTARAVASVLVADQSVIHLAALWNQDRRTHTGHMRTKRPSRRNAWQMTLER